MGAKLGELDGEPVGALVVGAKLGETVRTQMVSAQLLWHDDVCHSYPPNVLCEQYASVQA